MEDIIYLVHILILEANNADSDLKTKKEKAFEACKMIHQNGLVVRKVKEPEKTEKKVWTTFTFASDELYADFGCVRCSDKIYKGSRYWFMNKNKIHALCATEEEKNNSQAYLRYVALQRKQSGL